MDLAKVFKSPFTLIFSCPPYFSKIPRIKFIFSTEEIADSATTEEIYNMSQIYLNSTIAKYNKYRINRERLKETAYKLYIFTWEDEKKEWAEKDLYTVSYNVEEEIKLINERKNYNNSETIEGKFFIRINAIVYVFREVETDPDEVQTVEEYTIKKAITATECAICYENRPNVLYTRCLHFVACESCDKIGKFSECPICRKKIKDQRIKI